ncbi:hypothetical protein [Marinilabilia salmonicolor]|uniref:Uncharacterized protein n=1 Tax=Marinilabilia salmonicolor TaxID=989 RepID=A0A368UVC0_9BACT|nr:hypothetical protein [Marinilabilia salmonicolor]RCW31304.1 hypothetical protein DFO77_11820 [Marinilabilia salmonicolor]
MSKFILPPKVISDFSGYQYLIDLYLQIKEDESNSVELSFENTSWFGANLAAVLGAIVELVGRQGKKVVVSGICWPIESVLRRNRFLCEFEYPPLVDYYNTILEYRKFPPEADQDFMLYIKNELLGKPDFPEHSQLLGKRINENIFELYENARTHGRCAQTHTCGQYYPNKMPKRLDITIVDMGRTIKTNVNEFLGASLSGAKAIEWALQYGNTTKTGNISGGLGLDIIFNFIKLNQGKIQIISSDGYWEYRRGFTTKTNFEKAFPGTIANIEFNLDDSARYQLREEVPLDDIF